MAHTREPEPVNMAITEAAHRLQSRRPTAAPSDGAALAAKERDQRIAKALAALTGEIGARYSPELATADRFRCQTQAARAALTRINTIAGRVRQFVAEGRNIVLVGDPGTGKEHLLAIALHAAVRQEISCSYIGGSRFYGRFYAAIRKKTPDEKIVAALTAPTVLAIGDPLPPKGEPSDYARDKLFWVLFERYKDLRPTWATLNVRTASEANAALTGPVWRRLSDGAAVLFCDWPAFRQSEF